MAFPKFLKRKSTYIILVILLAGGWWFFGRNSNSGPQYETSKVEQRDLAQTVEVTGELKPAARIDLAFKGSGTIDKINVKVGDTVKAGDVLATLKAEDVTYTANNAKAALAVAQANLNAKLAGNTSQDIQVSAAAVEQAQASYDKAAADLDSTKKTTQDALKTAAINLQTAQNNLNNQDAIVSQNVQNAYDAAVATLRTALGPLQTGLTDGDTITGVDNSAANAQFVNVLGFLDAGSMDRAKGAYKTAKDSRAIADQAVNALTANSTQDDIQNATVKLQTAITLVQTYLTDVQEVLSASLTNSYFTEATLSAKKATIDADRTSVSAQNSSVLNALQSIKNTQLTKTQSIQSLQDAYKTAETAYETAKTNADVNVRTAETNVAIQKAALDQAKATLDLKKSGPRAVDVAPLRASVEQAKVAYDKAVNDLQNVEITAPVDGIISDVIPDVGEQVAPNVTAINMIGTQSYDIEAEVPEADITKILVDQTATTTLDAYGDEVKFNGKVTAKDPAETRIQDAIYYKIRVQIDPAGHEVKPGMTANVTVNTGFASNAIVIPLRAIRTDSTTGQKTVRVLVNGTPETRDVTLGLRGDEGEVQVLSGVKEGEDVIVGQTGATTPQG